MKAVVTVLGKDRTGIIAAVSNLLYQEGVNILDISQTIVQEYFNMMMIVDMNKAEKRFGDIAEELEVLGKEIGVLIKCQSEEIFNQMHRI